MEKVTIVLPVYNGQDHLTDSIDSIIKQTYSNWELIIVMIVQQIEAKR